ncbi:MAG TPA: recombinase family protein [Candidatus Acidoferrum sp.]|jgi:DNA invertase Pin-like site-specific DNA recombinase|nr:recombinase family protein [Candidatus Acidoferrum sp.]
MTKAKRCGIYVRVSTSDQSTKAQESELKKYAENRGWVVNRIYADKVSGTKQSRPELDELMTDCRKRKVDVVLVWKFDRFARSLRHLVSALEEFRKLGIDFVSSTEAVDTSLPSGELVLQIFGAMAQFERALTVERVKAGLAQARRDGKTLGRPAIKKLSEKEIERIRVERTKGVTLRELAKKFGASLWSIYQVSH